MSGIITPSGLVNELVTITDDDTISEVNVPGEAFNRKIKKSADKTYFQETLPQDISDIKDGTAQLNPRSYISGRFDSQESPESGSLTAGTYTIAETEDAADLASGCQLRIVSNLGVDLIEVDFRESASAKTHQNTKIELLNAVIGNFKLAKSDSVNGAGAKIQIILPSTTTLKVQLISNIGDGAGWQLVIPTSSGIGLCPDGVTAATFLEAGEELSFDHVDTRFFSNIAAWRPSVDTIRCVALWSEIPKQGTNITLTLPVTTLNVYDNAGTVVTITGAHTISNFSIIGKNVFFNINETGLFTPLTTAGDLSFSWAGANGKLTIT